MKDWKKALVSPEDTIFTALGVLDAAALRIALVADTDARLLGVVTDGDIRRGLLRGLALTSPVSEVMRREFVSARPGDSVAELLRIMREHDVQQVPLIDGQGRVTGLRRFSEIMGTPARSNWAVIMAGGLGTRLRPLTDTCPKPLLPVGGRPVIETIIEQLMRSGFRNFYISVNYLAEKIINHLGDGTRFGARFEYLREHDRLGTAGALSLIPIIPDQPFVVTNGDILTRLNFGAMLDFHNLNGACGTMGVREYQYQVPYGVIHTEGGRLVDIQEKPTQHHFVNGGIYVFSPEVLEFVPRDTYLDMPGLFTELTRKGKSAAVFPIIDYWSDIGSPEDLRKAEQEYAEVFL